MSTQDEIKKAYNAIESIQNYLNANRWEWCKGMSGAESALVTLRRFVNDESRRTNIFYEVLHSFHVDDAMNRVEEFLEENEDVNINFEVDFDYLADEFFEKKDCNIADNDTWRNIIEKYIEDNN